MKNYIGISRDHSGSMYSLARAATKDYNQNIEAIKNAAKLLKQDTIVSVVTCGSSIIKEAVNSSVNALVPLSENNYHTGGNTPLFDSIGTLIDQFLNVPDYNDPSVSFLIMAVTDGEENGSIKYNAKTLSEKIKKLQLTDRWTFIFRVPAGYERALANMGIPAGNIQVWEQSEAGLNKSATETAQAFNNYYTARSTGQTSTKSFYNADLSQVNTKDVKKKLTDVTSQVKFFEVTAKDNDRQIREFVESKLKTEMVKGGAFYQLMKKEEVQEYKIFCIQDKKTKKVYSGTEAKALLGLPNYGKIKLEPGDHGKFEIFIQSTSVNRKLKGGTKVLYWNNIGVPYK